MLPLEHSAKLWPVLSDNWSWNPIIGLFRVAVLHRFYCIHFYLNTWYSVNKMWTVPWILWHKLCPKYCKFGKFRECFIFAKLPQTFAFSRIFESAKFCETKTLAKVLNLCLIWFHNFSVMSGRVFLCWTSTKQGTICLAQGHNTVTPERLKSAALDVESCTISTEPLCCLEMTKSLCYSLL